MAATAIAGGAAADAAGTAACAAGTTAAGIAAGVVAVRAVVDADDGVDVSHTSPAAAAVGTTTPG